MEKTIEQELVSPFEQSKAFVLANPLSKRMPKGLHCERNGLTSVEVWCNEWQALCATWNITVDIGADQVFALRDKLFPN
jgi:hypothetical protein